jgi:AmmeMemoRadiSam system protein A
MGQPPPDPESLAARRGLVPGPALTGHRGAFVTLRAAGSLRGCIGTIEGVCPLTEAVLRNARAAACEDPRFAPVSPAELDGLDLEISALTPLVPVASPDDIVVGRHGVLLSAGGRRAVFLPQVASEEGWDRTTMLRHLARKAGLPPDAWRDGAGFQVFEAEVF